MDAGAALQLLLDAHRLKRTSRTGWVMRGVADAESVADHSFGVAFISLILTELVDQSLDKAKVLTIALLHDLPESVVSDLPTPAAVHFPPGTKRKAEMVVLSELLHRLPCAEQWHAWWHEFEDGTSVEGRLVRDADRLDMLIQAHIYEQTTGNRWLEEFWPMPESPPFEFAAAQSLYEELKALRQRSI
ncbi:MAG: HD domain-containing protein [Chloroflexota bacterium]|nr:HD domain-containing protein [Chloroflexota bacterium]